MRSPMRSPRPSSSPESSCSSSRVRSGWLKTRVVSHNHLYTKQHDRLTPHRLQILHQTLRIQTGHHHRRLHWAYPNPCRLQLGPRCVRSQLDSGLDQSVLVVALPLHLTTTSCRRNREKGIIRVGETMFVLSIVVSSYGSSELRLGSAVLFSAPFFIGLSVRSGSAGQTKRGDYSNVCESNNSPLRWPSARRGLVNYFLCCSLLASLAECEFV